MIVGRGSAYYLQSRDDAFHVFIYAPFEKKYAAGKQGGKSEVRQSSLRKPGSPPCRFHQAVFRRRMAGQSPFPFDDQFQLG